MIDNLYYYLQKFWGIKIFLEQNKFVNDKNYEFRLAKVLLFLGLILIGTIILSGVVSATDITVSNGTNSIKNAVSIAQPGDTLNLKSGVYKEHDIFINKDLTITGPQTTDNNPPTVIIDGQNAGSVFQIPTGVKVNLQYLQIQNGNTATDTYSPHGAGVFN